ncbi:MAG: 23S rRNA (uracil(1939)-C(5))-methyltransferase RlmD [Oscillospiraceae bacterium]|nr:23S rRNA (uracil(1939)-C(5))-methyltransferase RlmD [Oscillospiraceae bacterium]
MIKNEIAELNIIGMSLQGAGIARVDGMAVFVPGAATGDRIRAVIVKVKSNHAFARCLEVLSPSAQRITPVCGVFPQCGGCAFQHVDYACELALKESEVRETLRRIGGIGAPVMPMVGASSPLRYRNKAMLPVGQSQNGIGTGYFAAHSHRIIFTDDCPLQPVLFSEIAQTVCGWAQESGCPIYDETAHTGCLRHIYLRQSFFNGDILVTLVVNAKQVPRTDLLIKALCTQHPAVKGILLNHHEKQSNAVLGEGLTCLWGTTRVHEELCGLRFQLSPLSFFQIHPPQAEKLYTIAAQYANLGGGERILDLYCGTGTIGLSMAKEAKEVIGVEVVPSAIADANENARQNGIVNARFLRMDAADAAKQLFAEQWHPDVVLLDPPRKGCSAATLEVVAGMRPARIVYISCDPATLARDLALLAEWGYQTQEVTPVDMFPRTAHVECCALVAAMGWR